MAEADQPPSLIGSEVRRPGVVRRGGPDQPGHAPLLVREGCDGRGDGVRNGLGNGHGGEHARFRGRPGTTPPWFPRSGEVRGHRAATPFLARGSEGVSSACFDNTGWF